MPVLDFGAETGTMRLSTDNRNHQPSPKTSHSPKNINTITLFILLCQSISSLSPPEHPAITILSAVFATKHQPSNYSTKSPAKPSRFFNRTPLSGPNTVIISNQINADMVTGSGNPMWPNTIWRPICLTAMCSFSPTPAVHSMFAVDRECSTTLI